MQNVPRALWKELCANKRQLAEWVDLYGLGKDGAGDDDMEAVAHWLQAVAAGRSEDDTKALAKALLKQVPRGSP